jgi:hypothetical protein
VNSGIVIQWLLVAGWISLMIATYIRQRNAPKTVQLALMLSMLLAFVGYASILFKHPAAGMTIVLVAGPLMIAAQVFRIRHERH